MADPEPIPPEPVPLEPRPQRLTLVPAGATMVDACRWLYLDRNAGTHALTPTRQHRCAAGRASRYGPDLEHQAEYCLSRHHISCPRFLARSERDMAAAYRPTRYDARFVYRALVVVAGIEALTIAALLANAWLR